MKWGIGNIKGGSGGASNTMLTTTTDATENSGTYTLALSNLSETPKVNDYVVYVDSGNLTTLYQVSAIGSTNATLGKIGDIGGGKQLYIHYIQLVVDSSIAYAEITLQIINDSNVAFTKDSLATYATYRADRPINNIIANGYWFDKTNTKQYRVNKLYNYNGLQWNCTDCNVTSVAGSSIAPIYANFTYTISDSIIAL